MFIKIYSKNKHNLSISLEINLPEDPLDKELVRDEGQENMIGHMAES